MAVGVRFLVDHLDNNDFPLYTFHPVGLRWSYRLNEPGTISYGISYQDHALTTDGFAPKATRFQLNMLAGDATVDPELWDIFPLQAGFHDNVNVRSDDNVIWVSGKDWLAWLDQPYPFDYSTTLASWLTAGDSNVYWAAKTQEAVVNDLVTSLTAVAYDPEAPPLTLAFNGTGWTQTINYQVPWGDSTSILDHLRTISGQFDPYGFDFWVDYDKTVRLESPREQNPASLFPVAGMSDNQSIISFDWTNNGPRATETVATGSGFGNGRPWYRSTYAPSVSAYGRWKRMVSIANPAASVTDSTVVTNIAAGQGYLDRFPQKELRLTVQPRAIDPTDPTGFFYNNVGQSITVTYPFKAYHTINADFRVTGQDFYSDGSGNWKCDLILDQIYS